MAEQLAELNKTDTDGRVRLRASVTNSGSQTRAQLLSAIYSDVVSGYTNHKEQFIANAFIFVDGNQKFPLYRAGTIYKFTYVIGASSEVSIFEISMDNTDKQVFYSALRANNVTQHTDASSSTGWTSVELYY